MQAGGVLGRLARFLAIWLRGLAWRLDHAAGGAQVLQAALAALAERFPGAPEHWLADIARHMIAAGEPLPGVDAPVPPMEAAPPEEPRSRAPAPPTPPAARRARPALRLIGGDTRRRPATETTSRSQQRRPAKLRWLAGSPKPAAQPRYLDTPVSQRRQIAFAIDGQRPEPLSPEAPFEFRKAERLTNLSTAPDRVALQASEPAAIHRLAKRTFSAAREAGARDQEASFPDAHDRNSREQETGFVDSGDRSLREQETAFAAPLPPAPVDLSASSAFPAPPRTPVDFAPLRPAQRVSLSFPQAHAQRGSAEWAGASSTSWPALPAHEQTIDDAPSPASSLTDLVREQMAGQWSA